MRAGGGVFAVARGIFEHPMFANEPYTEREAWMWLFGEAAWKSARVRVGTKLVTLRRGQSSFSVRFMATKWKWHRARVERFLHKLKTETMIETSAEQGVTVVGDSTWDVMAALPILRNVGVADTIDWDHTELAAKLRFACGTDAFLESVRPLLSKLSNAG